MSPKELYKIEHRATRAVNSALRLGLPVYKDTWFWIVRAQVNQWHKAHKKENQE